MTESEKKIWELNHSLLKLKDQLSVIEEERDKYKYMLESLCKNLKELGHHDIVTENKGLRGKIKCLYCGKYTKDIHWVDSYECDECRIADDLNMYPLGANNQFG